MPEPAFAQCRHDLPVRSSRRIGRRDAILGGCDAILGGLFGLRLDRDPRLDLLLLFATVASRSAPRPSATARDPAYAATASASACRRWAGAAVRAAGTASRSQRVAGRPHTRPICCGSRSQHIARKRQRADSVSVWNGGLPVRMSARMPPSATRPTTSTRSVALGLFGCHVGRRAQRARSVHAGHQPPGDRRPRPTDRCQARPASPSPPRTSPNSPMSTFDGGSRWMTFLECAKPTA